jgi:hypothetical protein
VTRETGDGMEHADEEVRAVDGEDVVDVIEEVLVP